MNILRITQAAGIISSAWLAGATASASVIIIPALQTSRKDNEVTATAAVRIWKNIFLYGKATAPPCAVVAAAAFCYVARANRSLVLIGSALLTVGIVPFTLIVMNTTNNKMLAHAALSDAELTKSSRAKLSDQEADVLIQKWRTLNLIRGMLPLAGCALALLYF